MLLPHMVCNALVAGGRRSGARQQDEGCCSTHSLQVQGSRMRDVVRLTACRCRAAG